MAFEVLIISLTHRHLRRLTLAILHLYWFILGAKYYHYNLFI